MPRPRAKDGGLRVTLQLVVNRETAERLKEQAWRERRSTASLLRELLFAGEAALANRAAADTTSQTTHASA